MRRVLVCTGVLGGGTALVFVLAALTATLFPHGTVVASGWSGGMRMIDSAPGPMPVTLPMPAGGAVNRAPGWSGGVIAAPDVAGGLLKVQVDANGNPALDAAGNPIPDLTGVQP